FAGGLAGGSSALGLAARVGGHRALARPATFTAAAAVTASPILLIKDLGRPGRFVNMLRVVKPSSPMNVGPWILAVPGTAGGATGGVAPSGGWRRGSCSAGPSPSASPCSARDPSLPRIPATSSCPSVVAASPQGCSRARPTGTIHAHAVGVEVTPVPTGPRLAVALLDAVLERVPVGVLIVDPDLRVVRANAALCGLAGGGEAALVGRRLADVAPWIPEADARRVLESGTTEEIELADAGRPGRFVVDLQPIDAGDGAPALACLVRDVG